MGRSPSRAARAKAATTSRSWRVARGRVGRLAPHPPPRAACRLPGRFGRATHDGGDLLKGQAKGVVEHEGQPLGRWKTVEHHKEREADLLG